MTSKQKKKEQLVHRRWVNTLIHGNSPTLHHLLTELSAKPAYTQKFPQNQREKIDLLMLSCRQAAMIGWRQGLSGTPYKLTVESHRVNVAITTAAGLAGYVIGKREREREEVKQAGMTPRRGVIPAVTQ